MKRYEGYRTGSVPDGRRIAIIAMFAIAGTLSHATMVRAQTRTVRDTATAYGARLTAKGEPANLNPNRINDRISSRLDTRLSLRVERYRPDSVADPGAAFATRPTDNVRLGTETTLTPLSASQVGAMSPAQTSPRQADNTLPH